LERVVTNSTLEKASNIVFMFSCVALVALAGLLVYNVRQPVASWESMLPAPTARSSAVAAGTKLRVIEGVSYADAPLTVTLVVQSECPYCAASVPFYQKLAELRKTLRFQLVAASLESSMTMTNYVKERGIDVDRVANLKPGDIDTSGTPTLVLAGKDGTVIDSWLGQLSPAQEEQVTKRISAIVNKVV
jgi:hypothetical protein